MQKRTLSSEEAGTLILLAAVLFGGWFRIMPAWLAGFPINDGGMFYVMMKDLQVNHYLIPTFTTYNNSSIPFVYPPLGFYIGAALTDLFRFPTPLLIVQWLPGIINALCIPAFYLLAGEIAGNKLQGAISTLVFALTPHLTSWLSMGGGLTRSPGLLFMLLALTHIHRVFDKNNRRDVWTAIIFSSLTVLSHTEAPIYTIALAVYIWGMKSRSAKGLLTGVLIAAGTLALTAPWLYLIVSRHGLTPLLSAGQTSLRDGWSLPRLINIDFFTEEPYLDLIGAIGIIGLAVLAARRKVFIPGMFLVVALVHPRSAHIIGNIPLSMAVGFFVTDILGPFLASTDHVESQPRRVFGAPILAAILIPYLLGNLLYYEIILAGRKVSPAERSAMQWIKENTPAESFFLVVTGEVNGFCDPVGEWFPALTDRQSLATLQGNEWIKGRTFERFVADTQSLQSCAKKGLDCIAQEAKHFPKDFNYLYISLDPPTFDCDPTYASDLTRSLLLELKQSPQFEPVFTSASAAVFIKK